MLRLALTLWLSLPGHAHVQLAEEPNVAPAPAWVVEVALADEAPSGPESDVWRLTDSQVRWDGQERHSYTRFVRRFPEESDVQSGSQLSIDYDPSYQEVELHHLRLRRGDELIDQLDTARFDVIRPERERGWQVYSGRETLVVFLHDLRKGDELDYAYSLHGSNPVFAGHLFQEIVQRFGVSVERFHYRLVVPADVELQVREFPVESGPTAKDLGDERELVWSASDLEAVDYETDTPPWHWSEPRVQVSSMASWAEVVAWALPRYDQALAGRAATAQIEELAQGIRRAHSSPQARAVAALRFVQDEVRYLGIELGENSHNPSPVHETLDRRFGDCKDKSVLLVALLRELGLEAAPAFVSTEMRGHLDRCLPSPAVFDHVIVRLRLEGVDSWLDATRLFQRGDLSQVGRSNFGRALVVQAGEEGLVVVPTPVLTEPSVDSLQRFAFEVDGEGARLSISSTYRGWSADSMRSTLASYELSDLSEQYLDYYAAYYDDIELREALTVSDDEEANVIVTRESYTIPRFFRSASGGELQSASLYADGVSSYVYTPTERSRETPFSISHPVFVRQRVLASSPGGWTLPDEAHHITSAGAEFEHRVGTEGEILELEYSYRSLADHVPAQEVAEHLDRMGEVEELLEFPISLGGNPASAMGVAAAVLLGLTLLTSMVMGLLLLATRNSRGAFRRGSDSGVTVFSLGELLGSGLRLAVLCVVPVLVGLDWADLFVDTGTPEGDVWAFVLALLLGSFGVASTVSIWTMPFFHFRPGWFPRLHAASRLTDLAVLVAAGAGVFWLPGDQRALVLVSASLVCGLPWGGYWTFRWSGPAAAGGISDA